MSELDKQLEETLNDIFSAGHECCETDYCEAYIDPTEDIKAIRKAFKDAGWSPHLKAYHDAYLDAFKKEANLLSGQEWYDRFEKLVDEMGMEPPIVDGAYLTAARRAAGLEGEA